MITVYTNIVLMGKAVMLNVEPAVVIAKQQLVPVLR